MAAADINPTRMELIKLKERIVLARKGHKLLKQKRDALILEFFKILKKAQNLRGELAKKMAVASKSLAVAQLYHSKPELENVSLNISRDISLDVDVKNVMGVKIPTLETNVERRDFIRMPSYSIPATSAKIDRAVDDFDEVLYMVLKLAETETAIKRLIVEIEKTKRRVNALEYVLIPRLEEQKNMIAFRLEEMERDSFVSLKSIKRKLEYKAEV